MILDQYGKEIKKETSNSVSREEKAFLKSFLGVNHNFLQNLSSSGASVQSKIQRPFSSHPWVNASSTIIARVASQAPLKIFTETQKQEDARRAYAKKRGETFKYGRGKNRAAIRRFSDLSINKRISTKALEEDFNHPLNSLFSNPSPHLDMSQITYLTLLLQVLDGQVFWLYTYEGDLCSPGQSPDSIWIVPKACMKPIQESTGNYGELIGWEMNPPRHLPLTLANRSLIRLTLDDVTEFKTPNPENSFGGIGAYTAAAHEIENDLLRSAQDGRLLKNRGIPGGILKTEQGLKPDQASEIREMWSEMHEGEKNAYRVALLHSGLSWQDVQQSSTDQRDIEKGDRNRTIELASSGTPPSVLGITETTNYATQLGQDRNFWDKTLLPYIRGMERAIDSSKLMFEEPDSVMVLADLTQVESLRAGLELKVMTADKMTSQNLHMPPSVAFEIVGIDCPDYPGKDKAFVSSTLVTAEDIEEGLDLDLFDSPVDDEETEDENQVADSEDAGQDPTEPLQEPNSAPSGVGDGNQNSLFSPSSRTKNKRSSAIWRAFLVVQTQAEKRIKRNHKKWARNWRDEVLERFDSSDLGKSKRKSDFSLTAILPDLGRLTNTLGNIVGADYLTITEDTYEFSSEELGIPVFDIDDKAITDFWNRRKKLFTSTVGRTTYRRLKTTLTEGIKNSDTHEELRERILDAYKREITESRARTIARTESAGLMNGVRREMFQLQGFTKGEWTTALDEKVRPDHIVFGSQDPKDFDFNYLTLVGQESEGILRHPNDTQATAKQVINCRCVEIAAE